MNQTVFNTYWQKRTELRATKYWQNTKNVSKAIQKVYVQNYDQLQKEVALIYEKFMKTGKGAYKATYIKQLMTDIDPNLIDLFMKQNKEMKVLFGDTYQNEFYNSIFDLGKGGMKFSFTPLNSKALQKVLTYPWSGAGFSDRLWENKSKLYYNLKQTLTQGLIQGQDFGTMTRNLAGRMDVSYKQANVLVRTETQHFMNQAHKDTYEEAEIEEYIFSAAFEEGTCEECGALDGKQFKLSEAAVGVNYPLIHPQCRCDTIPALGQSKTGTRSAKIGDEWVEVPETMTFKEWKEKNEFAYLNPLGEKDIIEKVEEFQSAKTIKEAQEYANKFADKVSYKGLDVDTANLINKNFDEMYKTYNLNPIKIIETNTKKRASATAYYDSQRISFSTTLKGEDIVNRMTKSYKDGFLAGGEIINKEDILRRLVNHEMVHLKFNDIRTNHTLVTKMIDVRNAYITALDKTLNEPNGVLLYNKLRISDYANKNINEFASEAFNSYQYSKEPSKFAKDAYDIVMEVMK